MGTRKRTRANTKTCDVNSTLDLSLKSDSVKNKCRVCLKPATIPIFETEELPESLQIFAGIVIDESDTLPKHLCSSCHELLQSCMSFRSTAQETEKKLKKTLVKKEKNNIKVEVLEDDRGASPSPERKVKNYYCKRCCLEFKNKILYVIHIKSEEHRNFKVECTVCKGQFTAIYIKRHMLHHRLDPEKTYICDVCGKSFVIKGALNRHKAIHGLELPFKCELCPYRGRFTECLRMHMRKHTGEKPYACTECSARFTNKSNLNKHIDRHKTERNFKCEFCNRGYLWKRDLDVHMKVFHTGIKDHECDICGKAFGYRRQMMKHQLKVHNREKFDSGRVPLYLQAERQKEG